MVSAIKAAIGDLVVTFLWVFFSSMLGLATDAITTALDLKGVSYNGFDYASAVIITSLIFILVTIFTFVANALGGASFNPTGNASFYAAGVGTDTLLSMALRFPAQALGSVGGVLAIMEVMPPKYKHLIGGPSLKVSLHTGAIAEGVLTFVITFVVLLIILRGPRSEAKKTWLMAMSTVALITVGSSYTGPAMNPAFAFGWAYFQNWHNTWDQFYVYWICPFIGAILASWLFRIVFPPPVVKQKKA
ncbi:aquaporin SIP1-1 [Cajanus cajan]|uniref:Aquaporin SIP1-2 n=1 Tax=Cajanus cajan TaxID=3821 RepID=A0A151SZE4_CAJCA|nr:aquaporin SIP1-1 [Cajanus cajan]KYP60176.1 putative aquaporin SIP1-2 [Cajanus cajan]